MDRAPVCRYVRPSGRCSSVPTNTKGRACCRFLTVILNLLIKIAESERLSCHVKILPSDARTLYQLTRLSDDRFDALLEDGRINPGMKRNEAAAETRWERKEADEQRIMSTAPVEGKFMSAKSPHLLFPVIPA